MSAVSATERYNLIHDQQELSQDLKLTQDLLSDRLPLNWSKKTVMEDIDRSVTTFYDENGIPRACINEVDNLWGPSKWINLLTLKQSKAALEKERDLAQQKQRKETDEKLKQVLANCKNVKELSHF